MSRYTFQYDAASREVVQIDPLSRRTTAAYDAASQRVLRIDARGYRTTYVWDNGSRMIGRRYPDGSRVTMAFDAVGNRTKLHDSTGRYTTVWDSLSRERSVKNPAGKTITYAFDAASRRRLMVEPEGGRFTYGYFDDGLARFVENPQNQRTTWTHDAAGQTLVQRLANGTRASSAYDDAGRMLRLANLKSDGTTLSSFRDTWGAAGNRTSRIEADGVRLTWSYDATYQLTRERRGGANSYDITYTYDANSNRRVKLDDGMRTTYTCDVANQLVTFQDNTGITTLTWDGNGNQRTEQAPAGGITTNTWDFENRLTRVLLPAGIRNTMAYNADGQWVEMQVPSATTRYVWDESNMLAETDGGGVVQATYTLSRNVYGYLVSQRRSGTSHYFHFDPHGSTNRLTDGSQLVTDTYAYGAFGDIIASAGGTVNRYQWMGLVGYLYEPSLVLHSVRARWLKSAYGRWLSADPVGPSVSTSNIFIYAANAPTRFSDPSGAITIQQANVPSSPTACISRADNGEPVAVHWTFTLDMPAPCDGYLVQKVDVTCDARPCEELPFLWPTTYTYYEAWKVGNTKTQPPDAGPGFTDAAGAMCYPKTVKRRLKPASEGRLKTSHFEKRTVCRLTASAGISRKEGLDGESAQDGIDRSDYEVARPGLVWASYCLRTGH